MNEQYTHVVYGLVTVIQKFDTFWMALTPAGKKTVYEADMRPVAEVIPITPSQPPPSIEQEVLAPEPEPKDERININDASHSAIARALPMIGRLLAKRIVSNRDSQPDGRYTDFAHFQQVNAELFENADNWDVIEPLVKFEE
jgi:DNA uptake protein ComE-like DNA-binding protein